MLEKSARYPTTPPANRRHDSRDGSEFLPHPPAKVWQALAEPGLIALWLMENDFQAIVGHQFQMRGIPVPAVGFSGLVASEVLELDTGKRLRISWRDANSGNGLNSTVTWSVSPEGAGTRLSLVHDGFDPNEPTHVASHRIMSGGWRNHVLPRLIRTLVELESAELDGAELEGK